MEMGRDNSSLNVKVRVIIWNLSPLWVVKVVMGRRLLGVFMTVYMPTILINVIGHLLLHAYRSHRVCTYWKNVCVIASSRDVVPRSFPPPPFSAYPFLFPFPS